MNLERPNEAKASTRIIANVGIPIANSSLIATPTPQLSTILHQSITPKPMNQGVSLFAASLNLAAVECEAHLISVPPLLAGTKDHLLDLLPQVMTRKINPYPDQPAFVVLRQARDTNSDTHVYFLLLWCQSVATVLRIKKTDHRVGDNRQSALKFLENQGVGLQIVRFPNIASLGAICGKDV